MSTPVFEKDNEKDQYSFPAFAPSQNHQTQDSRARRSSDEDGTLHGETDGMMDYSHNHDEDYLDHHHLRVTTSYADGPDHLHIDSRSPRSPSQQREQARRLDDDLLMLRAERVVSNAEKSNNGESLGRSKSMARSRSRNNTEPVDDFDVGTTPIHEKNKIYQPPPNPTTKVAKFFKKIHNSSFLVRYFSYISPLTLLLLIPLLLGLLVFKQSTVGGVELFWFGVWLEIVWLTLWASRIIAKMIPWPMGMISSLFTNNDKKWRDLGKALEVPATLFFWWLAIEVSFLPTMKNHHLDGNKTTRAWENTTNKVLVSIFVGVILNFIEKIIIQLIAISFHLRTYSDRIDVNKFQIGSLVKLYIYSKEKIAMEDSEFEQHDNTGPSSGARTPMLYVHKAQRNARHVFNRVGDVAAKVGGDFTGKAVMTSTHPQQVILQLLHTTTGSQVLARRLYRTFGREDVETIGTDDIRMAFDNDEEADAAFAMFDKDLNGDISMEELEAVCVEVGRERKAITASLKDLDSVVSKLDGVLLFAVFVITILVFVSLISTSAETAITSLGSTVLALSWLFSATAQEFLQSLIFVFVKHPLDVGDRVTIYGNTGSLGKGDDYFVKEISLLYTEFKKMEGHVVQAPNSYLNTLFILNQRRSGGLAEAVPVTVKFGTTLEQIESLRNRLLEFVGSENREYQKNILTELTTIYEAYSITLNVVFFYKSNWQNELLRLQRRNKFICALMVTLQELGIEGPRMGHVPGAAGDYPLHVQSNYAPNPNTNSTTDDNGPGPRSGSLARDGPFVPSVNDGNAFQPTGSIKSHPSILRSRGDSRSRNRGESISQMGKRVDFSLGMSGNTSGADFGDVYDRPKPKIPLPIITSTSPSPSPGLTRASLSRDSRQSEESESQLSKIGSSDSRSTRTHRNRFFGRRRGTSKLGNTEEGTSLEDLEAGAKDFGKSYMPDIPEASGANTAENSARTPTARQWGEAEGSTGEGGVLQQGSNRGPLGFMPEALRERGSIDGVGRGRMGTTGEGIVRIDPRSGIVSPQAVTRDSARERGELPQSAEQDSARH